MDKRNSLILLLILCRSLPLWSLTLVYIEETISETVEHTISIDQTPIGYSIVVISVKAASPAFIQTLETDRDFSVRTWRYQDREAGTDVVGSRSRSTITLEGRYRARVVKRRFAVDSKPWYQLFPIGLEQLVLTQKQETLFYAIGYDGIGAMRIGTFRAQRGEPEAVKWRGRLVSSVNVRISLAGIAAILWTGEYWLRPEDGRSLVARSDRGPGTRANTIELISEN